MKVRGASHDATAHFAPGRVTLERGGESLAFDATDAGAGCWVLTDADGRREIVHVARDKRGAWVHARGRAWLVERGEARSGSGGAADGTLTAPMTGKVLEVLVAQGDAVSEGQPLLVLSAMKMRLEIKSPRAGIVKVLHAKAGEQVEGGDTMVVVEEAKA